MISFWFGETEAGKRELPATLSSVGSCWVSPTAGHSLSSSVAHWIQIKEMQSWF